MKKASLMIGGLAVLAGCATYVAPTKEESTQAIKSSFNARGIAKLDRLDQNEIQAVCSEAQMAGKEVPKEQREALEKKILATIKYPTDGKYLGDFKTGERIAQSGVGHAVERQREDRSTAATATPATRSRRRRSRTATSARACMATASCAATASRS